MGLNNPPASPEYKGAEANTERTLAANNTYTKKKEIQLARCGSYQIKFDLKKVFSTGPNAQIYKNGAGVGTERTATDAYVTFTETIANWIPGDLCQLYIKTGGADASRVVYIKNFSVYATAPLADTIILD